MPIHPPLVPTPDRAKPAARNPGLVPSAFAQRIQRRMQRRFRKLALTWQEKYLVIGTAAGLSNKQIGEWTGWTESTVETYWKALHIKLGTHSKAETCRIIIEELLDACDERRETRDERRETSDIPRSFLIPSKARDLTRSLG